MSLQETLDGSHLVMAPEFTSARFQLLAMDESLAAQIEQGAELTIKGGDDTEAVLCSSTATYSLRVVESSNSTLLAQDAEAAAVGSDPDQSQRLDEKTVVALGSVPHVWEVKPVTPLAEPLVRLLAPSAYSGADGEAAAPASTSSAQQASQTASDAQLYSFGALLSLVQCSPAQLRALLQRVGAFCLDGKYRLVADGYWYQCVDAVLVAAAEHGLQLDRLVPSTLFGAVTAHCEATGQTPLRQELLLHILHRLGAHPAGEAAPPVAPSSISMDSGEVSLDLALLARHRAREVLQSLPRARPSMDALAFAKTWHQTLKMHDGVGYAHCSASALRGVALLLGGEHLPAGAPGVLDGDVLAVPEGGSVAQQVLYLPEDALPEQHTARFAALFAAQELWRLEQLEPYLNPVKGPSEAVSDMLLAHCRYVTQADGSKLYCAK